MKIYYSNPGCHIEKTRALFSLGKKPEAVKSLEISARLAQHALEGEQNNLEQARAEIDKKYHASRVHLFESQLRYIEKLRSDFVNEP